MKQKHLKIFRVVFSLLLLLGITSLFVDFRELIPTAWADRLLFLQFVPSVIQFITVPAVLSAGFIIILVLTALFGRVYCSFICPLGIFQDIVSWISKKAKVIKRYKFRKALNYLRYPVLALVVISLLFGSMFVLNLLDPYSSFGRIFSDIVRPGIIAANNGLASLFEKFDMYFLYRLNLDLVTWKTVFIPAVLVIAVVVLAFYYGRLYCNAICPVGTVLGFLSRFSVFRIRMDKATCTKCGKCAFACKSTCINIKTQEVDNSRCVACYNCIDVCPENSIKYMTGKGSAKAAFKPVAVTTDDSKREFIGKTLVYAVALTGLSEKVFSAETEDRPAGKIKNPKKYPVTPPGSVSIRHFTDRCTACHLCISVCPTKTLQPSFLEYGFTGMSQPHMDYGIEYCNFECTKCGEVCPTGAILPITVEEKKLEQLGKVNFVKTKCIVYTDNTSCGSCSEHCPTQAVKMVPYKDDLTIPETDTDICIGCGACEFACPVKPHTAIFVDGNTVHQVAKAPKVEELKQESSDDFLF
ncbi:MAG TPA: 4Fe-4S binding protein [Bacteroidales bacterium]|nr:4Fe-4S binding protein [Bacteroidales bacterium]